jgi:hypothetical protein
MANDHAIKFAYLINGKTAHTSDPTPTSLQLLADAAYEPAEDYVLIQRTQHGTKVVQSDEGLDLQDGTPEFFAFDGGVALELTVNTHAVWWGASQIEIADIRRLANVPEEDDLIWVRDESTNEVLPREGRFEIGGRGVEHLHTHKRPTPPVVYHYFVAGVEYTTEHESLTGAQIISNVPNWNPQNSLVLESDGAAPDEVIHPTTVVEFKGRTTPAHFAIVPPATFGDA